MPDSDSNRTLLLIGASRGLGLAIAAEYLGRGWNVVATVRGTSRTGLHDLQRAYVGRLQIEGVDINDPTQISALHDRLVNQKFNTLFVNAGVTNDPNETIGQVSTEEFVRVMVTNALSPMRAIEILEDLVHATGTIGLMSSELGSVADNEKGSWEVYRGSKAALNTLMRSFAARHAHDTRAMVIVAPGWVRTDMGGPEATLSIEESIPNVVDMLIDQFGKPGLRYLNYLGYVVRW
jgi:NAD(P)-dependent dehydrogenase (short-subunit alcohol dehydrogenase family)